MSAMASASFEWQPSDHELALVPLPLAAALACETIVGRLPDDMPGRERRCNAVAAQIAALVPIYVKENGTPRVVTRIELMLARFEGGGARLVHRDRSLVYGDLRIRRIDLADAIERLHRAHRPAGD
jgi:hypothetical protein